MYYYFLFRKIIFSLLVLAGIGFIILLVRFYWGSPEEQTIARMPVPPPVSQEKLALAPPEVKTDQSPQVLPKTETETKSPLGSDSTRPTLATPAAVPESVPKVPSPPLEKKSTAPALTPEVKPSTSPLPKEVKKETPIKEGKKETKIKETASVTKPAPADSKKSENGNNPISDHKTLTVKAGDSIYAIAENTYRVSNTSVVDRIMALNPKIADPDQLPANQKIKLPDITEESLILSSSDESVMIRVGTFMKPEYASFLKSHPALQGKEIKITPWVTPSGKTLYRVTAGKFDNREEGLQVIRDLREKGLSPYFEGFKKKN